MQFIDIYNLWFFQIFLNYQDNWYLKEYKFYRNKPLIYLPERMFYCVLYMRVRIIITFKYIEFFWIWMTHFAECWFPSETKNKKIYILIIRFYHYNIDSKNIYDSPRMSYRISSCKFRYKVGRDFFGRLYQPYHLIKFCNIIVLCIYRLLLSYKRTFDSQVKVICFLLKIFTSKESSQSLRWQ